MAKQRPLWTSVYQCLLLLLTLSSATKVASEEKVLKIVSGLYWSDLPNPIWYEAYAAAVVEVLTPRLDKNDLMFNNWYNCTSETTPFPYSCPTTFYLNQHMKRLQGDFENIHPGASDLGTSQRAFLEELVDSENFCHVVQEHFPEMYIADGDYKWYLEQLEACLSDGVTGYQYLNKSEYGYNARTVFSRMEKAFYEKFFNKTSVNGTAITRVLASATLANSRNVLQALVLGSFYAERLRWGMVDNHCGMKRLPSTVVGEEDLKAMLGNITKAWSSSESRYELSIPQTMLAKYYEQPLTDCAHVNKTLIVRLLIPLVQAKTDQNATTARFTLKSAKIAKFHIGNHVCQILGIPDAAKFVYDSVSKIAYKTDCVPGHLCDVSPHTKAGQEHACATSVFTNNIEGIQHNCEYSCKAAEPKLLGKAHDFQIRRIGRSKIVVAGNHIRANVTCPVGAEGQTQVFQLKFPSPTHGAVEFNFKCKCDLVLESHHRLGSYVTLPAMLSRGCSVGRKNASGIEEVVQVQRIYPWRYIDEMGIWNTYPGVLEHTDGSAFVVSDVNEAIANLSMKPKSGDNMDNSSDEDKVIQPPQHQLDSNEARAIAAATGASKAAASAGPARTSADPAVGIWTFSVLLLVAVIALAVANFMMFRKLKWVQNQAAMYRVTYTNASEFDVQQKGEGYSDPLLI